MVTVFIRVSFAVVKHHDENGSWRIYCNPSAKEAEASRSKLKALAGPIVNPEATKACILRAYLKNTS